MVTRQDYALVSRRPTVYEDELIDELESGSLTDERLDKLTGNPVICCCLRDHHKHCWRSFGPCEILGIIFLVCAGFNLAYVASRMLLYLNGEGFSEEIELLHHPANRGNTSANVGVVCIIASVWLSIAAALCFAVTCLISGIHRKMDVLKAESELYRDTYATLERQVEELKFVADRIHHEQQKNRLRYEELQDILSQLDALTSMQFVTGMLSAFIFADGGYGGATRTLKGVALHDFWDLCGYMLAHVAPDFDLDLLKEEATNYGIDFHHKRLMLNAVVAGDDGSSSGKSDAMLALILYSYDPEKYFSFTLKTLRSVFEGEKYTRQLRRKLKEVTEDRGSDADSHCCQVSGAKLMELARSVMRVETAGRYSSRAVSTTVADDLSAPDMSSPGLALQLLSFGFALLTILFGLMILFDRNVPEKSLFGTLLILCGTFLAFNSNAIATYVTMYTMVKTLKAHNASFVRVIDQQRDALRSLKSAKKKFSTLDTMFGGSLRSAERQVEMLKKANRANVLLNCAEMRRDVAFSFLYRAPRCLFDWLCFLWCSSEPGISLFFRRRFFWYNNMFDPRISDTVPTVLCLSEHDQMVPAATVRAYAQEHMTKAEISWWAGLGHTYFMGSIRHTWDVVNRVRKMK
eukprot:TRINITY_DN14473_c0_g2_i2.p1 TRINITY_DN14473_c0_g2~~TRINITY_DN14473_c0_g2_i2.p1  ORF type:complete len:633 (+),score=87.82 TRINITY_DN14473_c0_g2_i2:46-1944(+)